MNMAKIVESIQSKNTEREHKAPIPEMPTDAKPHKLKTTLAVTPIRSKLEADAGDDAGTKDFAVQKTSKPELSYTTMTLEEVTEKYPILKNEELVKRFLAVPMSNNQKGRIRQLLRDNLKSASSGTDPEVISQRISAILQNRNHLTDSDLRKIRILHNMLKTATDKLMQAKELAIKKNKKKKKKNKNPGDADDVKNEKDTNLEEPQRAKTENAEKENVVQVKKVDKVRGPKRYVVFVGNLPYDIDNDGLRRHFSSLAGSIRDVRIPKCGEGKKGGIAYMEFSDENSYQMALSKHHSMMGNRRINVLYTTTGKGKVDKSEAKSKSAKLVALQKSGLLLGSTALNKKRSARRKKQRDALAKLAEQK